MSDKWTPGPWEWDEIAPEDKEWGACEIRAADDSLVCTHVFGTENARLISAAPDMAEALEKLIGWEDAIRAYIPNGGLTSALTAARSALAKARGEICQIGQSGAIGTGGDTEVGSTRLGSQGRGSI